MKKHIYVPFFLPAILLVVSMFSGCEAIQGIFNKVPEEYTEGIDYDRDFPDDVFEIYDDAIVFDEDSSRGAMSLTFGTEDDLDDIIDFYHDFFDDNDITLLEEEEDKDEYYARGVFDGYEFEIQVEAADGEYIEDLFEYVIELTTEELDEDAAVEATAETTAAPTSEVSVEATEAPSATEESSYADTLERPDADATETRLTSLDTGYWTTYYYNDTTYDTFTWMWSFYIDDATSGTMYYADLLSGNQWWDDFTYVIEDGLVSFYFDDGDIWDYFAYYDYYALHLIPAYDFSDDYYMTNYGDYYDYSYFNAYGDWGISYYDDDDQYFIGTIAFWPDNTGYVYNWYGEGYDMFFTWEDNGGQVTMYDEDGYIIDTFSAQMFYNIMEYYSTDESYGMYFYSRVNTDIIPGSYSLSSTTETGLYTWDITFYSDSSASVTIESSSGTFTDEYAYWYIDTYSGNMYLYMGDTYYTFYYHSYYYGIKMVDESTGYYYDLEYVG